MLNKHAKRNTNKIFKNLLKVVWSLSDVLDGHTIRGNYIFPHTPKFLWGWELILKALFLESHLLWLVSKSLCLSVKYSLHSALLVRGQAEQPRVRWSRKMWRREELG